MIKVHNNIRFKFLQSVQFDLYVIFCQIQIFFRIKIGQCKLTLILSKLEVFRAKIYGSSETL